MTTRSSWEQLGLTIRTEEEKGEERVCKEEGEKQRTYAKCNLLKVERVGIDYYYSKQLHRITFQ